MAESKKSDGWLTSIYSSTGLYLAEYWSKVADLSLKLKLIVNLTSLFVITSVPLQLKGELLHKSEN